MIMFPAGINSYLSRGEDYNAAPHFLYADENMFCYLNGDEFANKDNLRWTASSWTFELTEPFSIGSRHLGSITNSMFIQEKDYFGYNHIIPTPTTAQNLTNTLIDSWLIWSGSINNRLLDSQEKLTKLYKGMPNGFPMRSLANSGIDLGKKLRVRVEGGYVGGLYDTDLSTTAWLENTSNIHQVDINNFKL